MSTRRKIALIVGVLAVAVVVGAIVVATKPGTSSTSSRLPQGSETVSLSAADFTTDIDNPYWPMKPGNRWVYRETNQQGADQRVVVTVTEETKRIANGITARVVHDAVTEDGEPVEVTDDWYAQDKDGNIWYLGEATTEYENGKAKSTEGSFEAGKDGAQAGIIMPGHPKSGMKYRQEYLKGEAEDKGEILSANEQVEVAFGHFRNVLLTKDLNPLEPKLLEYKWYARGVGPVLALAVSGGSDREELLTYTKGT